MFLLELSYAYYLTRDDLSVYATPFKHEFYGYVRSRKGWLRPGFSMGWATGTYTDIKQLDTVIFGIPRRFIDTTKVGLQDFSMTFSLAHHFDFDDLFKKGDGLSISPQVMVTAGAQNYEADSKTTFFQVRVYVISHGGINPVQRKRPGFAFNPYPALSIPPIFMNKLSLSAGYFINYYYPKPTTFHPYIFGYGRIYFLK